MAVMALAVVLWATETLHIAVTGLVGIVMLVLVDAVDDVDTALYGFSQPVTYFLLGILTLGLAVHQSGLAQRLAVYLIRMAAGSPKKLYIQMLASFAALTFALPSASTRGAIMVHVYEEVLDHWKVEENGPLEQGGDDCHGRAEPVGVHGSIGWRHNPSGGLGPDRRLWCDR